MNIDVSRSLENETFPKSILRRLRAVFSDIFVLATSLERNLWILGAILSKLVVYAILVATHNNLSQNWFKIKPPTKIIFVEVFCHPKAMGGLVIYAIIIKVCATKWGPLQFEVPRFFKVFVETAMINVSIFLAAVFDDYWSLAILCASILHLICLCQLTVIVDTVGLYDTLVSCFGAGIFTEADKYFSKSVAISISSGFTLLMGSLKHFHQFKLERLEGTKLQKLFAAVKKPVDDAVGAAKSCAEYSIVAADAAKEARKFAGKSNASAEEVEKLAADAALKVVLLENLAMKSAASSKTVVKFAKYIVNAPQPSTEEGVLSLEIQKVLLDGAMAESDLLAEEVLAVATTVKGNHERLIDLAGKASEAAGITLAKAITSEKAAKAAMRAAESSDTYSQFAAEVGKQQQQQQQPKRPGLRQRKLEKPESFKREV